MNTPPSEPRGLSTLQVRDFTPYVLVDDAFRIRFTSEECASTGVPETLALTLIEAHPLPPAASPNAAAEAAGRRAGFSLVFSAPLIGPMRGYLPQRVYRIEHATLGCMDIFVVPIGVTPDGSAMRYQAIFN